MKKLFGIYLFISLISFCLGQYPTTDILSSPLPQGKIIVAGNGLAVLKADGTSQPVKLRGSNYTWDAPNDGTAIEFADKVFRNGDNWVRLHHDDPIPLSRKKELLDALYARGIYVSMDSHNDRWINQKRLIYEGDEKVRGELLAYWQELSEAGILDHPGLWMICLVNEGATELGHVYGEKATAMANETYQWGKENLTKLGFKGLLGDLPDGFVWGSIFGPSVARQDISLIHFYGHHPQGDNVYPINWAETGYHWKSILTWMEYKRPAVIQESGCLMADNRGINEAFLLGEILRNNISGHCVLQWASNPFQMRGEYMFRDDYSIVTDYYRTLLHRTGILLEKFNKSPQTAFYWGYNLPTPIHDARWSYVTNEIKMYLTYDKGTIIIKAGTKKRYVILLDEVINRFYKTVGNPDGSVKVIDRGTNTLAFWEGKAIDIGYPISGAYRLNPYTLEKEITLTQKSGNIFITDRSVGLFEINLR